MSVRRPFPSVQWMIATALVADAAVLATIALLGGSSASASRPAAPPVAAAPDAGAGGAQLDRGWGMCFHEQHDVQRVAITYLDAGIDARVTEAELLRWFGKLPFASIEVWKLEHKDGTRRIAFELDWTRWPGPPGWDEVTRGWRGDDLCSALRRDLITRGVGRPRPPEIKAATDDVYKGRHDFEFFDERRADRYRDRDLVGTLADVIAGGKLPELQRWLAATERKVP